MSMRHLGMRRLAGLALFGGVIALAACSSISGSDGSSNTSPSTDTGGPVSISTDHAQYGSKDSIQVTVTNHTQQAIYAWDTKASCSILDLEVQNGGDWEPSSQAQCAIKRAAMSVKIEPGAVYTATIRAGMLPGSNTAFPGGSYRLTLAYGGSPTLAASGATIVYSALLTIIGGPSNGGGFPSSTPANTPPTN
jgi:hypothetical protein